jgi:hypothetical protein
MGRLPETFDHPNLGRLRWLPKVAHWFTRVRLSSGGTLDVVLDPGDDDMAAFVGPAADLCSRAVRDERRVLRAAVRAELLDLFNGIWRRREEPELTTDKLIGRLMLELVTVDTVVPVTFHYGAGGLFGGHGVAVEADGELRFVDLDLRG